MPKLLGIIGMLVICAGIDLLWQSRREIRFWIVAYLAFFRALLRDRNPELPTFAAKEVARNRQGAVRFLLGVSFAFLLGPILIAVGVTLMFYPHL
ncbi:MAG: hypothetical protein WA211_09880 [Candidatus Acidiferrales bacterium]